MYTPIYTISLNQNNLATISREEEWLKRFDQVIQNNLDILSLGNKKIARELWVSERQLFRKVKELTGSSPKKYLRKYRLREAMKYLKTGKYRTVKEVAYAVGYTKASYFVTQFEKEYSKRPLQILQTYGWR